jgi:hypothetical protein
MSRKVWRALVLPTSQGGESVDLASNVANTRGSVADDWDTEVGQTGHIGSTLEARLVTEQLSPQAVEIVNVEIARLKSFGTSHAIIVNLGQRELSMHLAAYLVMYDRYRQLEYEKLQQSILIGFRKNCVDGEALSGSHVLYSVNFVEVVWLQLGEDELATAGYLVK